MTMPTETPLDVNSPAESTSAGAESVGAWLAQARVGFQADQREVARHLGLNPTIIEAIERDDFGRLGPPVFVRGYLSRYARLLNLPEQAVLERYRLQSGPTVTPPPLKMVHPLRRQTRVRDLRGVFYLLLLVGIAWTAIQNLNNLDPSRLLAFWSDGDGKTGQEVTSATSAANTQTQYPFQAEPATTPSPPSSPLATESASSSHNNVPALPASSTPNSPTPAMPVAPTTPTAPVAAPSVSGVIAATTISPVPGSSAPATIASVPGLIATATTLPSTGPTVESGGGTGPGEAKLLLEFSNDCWVEVKDAQGNVLANGLMKANSTRAISGSAPFKVTLGNAPAARIILDDRLVNTDIYVPRRGTVSRFTLDRGQP